MFLSRIMLRKDVVRKPDFWRLLGDGYQVHRQIWTLMAVEKGAGRDFLYRREDQANWPTFYILSERRPENGKGMWNVESKFFHPELQPGQRLAFVLRANPVRSKWEGENGQKRHDVVMDAKTRLENEGVARENWPSNVEIVRKEGYAWLSARSERCGFAIAEGEVIVDGYRQNRFVKPNGGFHVRLSSLDFSGRLTVTDPDLFVKALTNGIGPAKAFGCGLILVKRG